MVAPTSAEMAAAIQENVVVALRLLVSLQPMASRWNESVPALGLQRYCNLLIKNPITAINLRGPRTMGHTEGSVSERKDNSGLGAGGECRGRCRVVAVGGLHGTESSK